MINMIYDVVLGVRYTFDDGQPLSDTPTNAINTSATKAKTDFKQVRAKQILRNNIKQK